MRLPPASDASRRRDRLVGYSTYAATLLVSLPLGAVTLSRGLNNPKDASLMQLGISIVLIGIFLALVWTPFIMLMRRKKPRPRLAFTAFTGLALTLLSYLVGSFIALRGISG